MILSNPLNAVLSAWINKSITPSTAASVPETEFEITVISPVVTGSSLASPVLWTRASNVAAATSKSVTITSVASGLEILLWAAVVELAASA